MFVLLSSLVFLASVATAQDAARPVCAANELFNGVKCTCAPGYFASADSESTGRCDDECEEVYNTMFSYGKCVRDIFGRVPKDQQPTCNLRCGMRLRLHTTIGLLCVFAAAIATLIFTLPMCLATCSSCLHAKKANRNAKRVVLETQNPSKDQQVASMSYGPYAYWPYYGR